MKHVHTFESFVYKKKLLNVNESLGDTFDTSGISRPNLNKILDILNNADISYDFEGPTEMLSFDSTELDRNQMQQLNKLGLKI